MTAPFEAGINGFQDFVVDLQENIFLNPLNDLLRISSSPVELSEIRVWYRLLLPHFCIRCEPYKSAPHSETLKQQEDGSNLAALLF